MNITHLKLSWSVSRGRDTEGYNICRLDDTKQGKRYRCMGGGYDMTGTVFGDWLEDTQQKALQTLKGWNVESYGITSWKSHPALYGMFLRVDGTIHLDGACGIESMIRIAEAIGLEVEREGNKKGHTIGFYVCPKEEK